MTSNARKRFPPPVMAYRMALATGASRLGWELESSSSAASTAARSAASASLAAACCLVVPPLLTSSDRLERAVGAFDELLHAHLRLSQLRRRLPQTRHALLEQLECAGKIDVLALRSEEHTSEL